VLAGAVLCGLLLALPACQMAKYHPADPAAPLPGSYNGVTTPDNSAMLRVDEFFDDPLLLGLIHQALANNQELKILAQDIRIAQNEILARTGAFLPMAALRGGAGFEKSSRYTRNGAVDEQLDILPGKAFPKPLPDFLVAADISWQIDIWRKLRNARDAARLRYLATAEGRNYVITRMVAEIATNYYGLMALDQRLDTLDQTITLQQASLEAAKANFEAGRGTELPVRRFEAEVRRNQSERLVVRQEMIETENRINFLAGRFPQRVERPPVDFLDLNLHALAVGLPAQILRNRPDIRQAEQELAAAGLDVKAARAEFFPSLALTSTVGYEAFNPRYLFNPEAFVANVAGNLVQPLVNRLAIRALYGTASAKQLQAVYNYQRVILDAFTEVVNRVSMAENYRRSVELKKQQMQALQAAVTAASNLWRAARAEYIEVLLAQRDLRDARMILIDTKRQQLAAVIGAYQALGGGCNLGPLPAVDPRAVVPSPQLSPEPPEDAPAPPMLPAMPGPMLPALPGPPLLPPPPVPPKLPEVPVLPEPRKRDKP
jgi:NodT family efflux transporter outer membrane factor (OMF) lipoprotein